ncbi:hypothetical protein WR52_19195 [Bacillus cereus]|uniref:hypothetical protein n=1 Tax=Bacillus cereus TaxID=1396 RepID=UPI0007B6C51C|nr:hypothetical protein [Bacillus cereus]ANC20799.1 hypothetical protein WR52_19195 [Bacillus cereus]MRC30227.1 hypothetical protein [Bacillus thuringiensis]
MDLSWISTDVLKWVGSTIAGAGLISYYIKKKISNFLDERLEEQKEALKKQTELYKSELLKINHKYQITFSKLHENRAEAIQGLYSKLIKLESNARGLINEFPTGERPNKKSSNTINSYIDLDDYFVVNKLYFSKDICNSFERIQEMFSFIVPVYDTYYVLNFELSDEDMVMKEDRLQKMRDSILEITTLKSSIEYEFRKMLGVIDFE